MSKDSQNTLSIIKSQNKDLKNQLEKLKQSLKRQQFGVLNPSAHKRLLIDGVLGTKSTHSSHHNAPHTQSNELIQAHKLQQQQQQQRPNVDNNA